MIVGTMSGTLTGQHRTHYGFTALPQCKHAFQSRPFCTVTRHVRRNARHAWRVSADAANTLQDTKQAAASSEGSRSDAAPDTDPLMMRAARGEKVERPPCW